MDKRIEKIRSVRLFLLKQVGNLNVEQLNAIPPGYSNNVVWNLAHLICAQQSMCYVRSGLPIGVEDRFFSPYLPGTRPVSFIAEQDINLIKTLLISTVDQLQADFDNHLFSRYSPSAMTASVYGVAVTTLDDALEFLLYHEGFHSGYVLALKHRL